MRPTYSRKKSELTTADPISWPVMSKTASSSSAITSGNGFRSESKDCKADKDPPLAAPIMVTQSSAPSYRRLVRQCNFCQVLYSSFHTCRTSS